MTPLGQAEEELDPGKVKALGRQIQEDIGRLIGFGLGAVTAQLALMGLLGLGYLNRTGYDWVRWVPILSGYIPALIMGFRGAQKRDRITRWREFSKKE
jgi:hypothetical protein